MDPVTIGLMAATAVKSVGPAIAGLVAERKGRKRLEELAAEGVAGQVSTAEEQEAIGQFKEAQREREGGEYVAPESDDPEQKRKLAQMRAALTAKGVGGTMRDLGQQGLQRYQLKKEDILADVARRKEGSQALVEGIGTAAQEGISLAALKSEEGLGAAAKAVLGTYNKATG